MEDGNIIFTQDDKIGSASLTNLYSDRYGTLATNGYDVAGEQSSPPNKHYESRRHSVDTLQEGKIRKRINPLKIQLEKRPFVDSCVQYNVSKNRKVVSKSSDVSVPQTNTQRVPKLVPKRVNNNQFHNAPSHMISSLDNEQDKPVPRLVPKSQLLQFNKGKVEKGAQLKEYAQSLGLQPMVKFKCRKCCSMSFKTLKMLKEHQLVCRAQVKESMLSPEIAQQAETSTAGPSRVTRKVYLCSACGTYYENWNLFLHMKEVHNRHICLFCLGMFSKAEKLSSHLINKHHIQEFDYDSKEDFCKDYNGTFYLMCCVCDEVCTEQDDYFNHDCNNVKPRPVPVLINKNALKSNNASITKFVKSNNENGSNGFTIATLTREHIKPVNDKKDFSEVKSETTTSKSKQNDFHMSHNEIVNSNSDTSISTESPASTSKDMSCLDSSHLTDCPLDKSILSPLDRLKHNLYTNMGITNGNEQLDLSDNCDMLGMNYNRQSSAAPHKTIEPSLPPLEKDKECGIKLKLSLNNVNSPVIINSTVDPSIGQQYAHKPPSRNRRPPKRYEKGKPPDPAPSSTVKPPSIKMTICDKADSPFVKTTIIENNEDTTMKTLVNNNIETFTTTPEFKPENAIKSTIYDNKVQHVNTLNRVPKLTVRVPKEFLDKNSSSEYSSDSDTGEQLTVDDSKTNIEKELYESIQEAVYSTSSAIPLLEEKIKEEQKMILDMEEHSEEKVQITAEASVKPEPEIEALDKHSNRDINVEEPIDPIVTEDIPVTELTLDRPIDKYPLKDLLKVFLTSTVFNCIYCNHVRRIAVDCEQLALHMVAQHRFSATVDSITAEELMPQTITAKVKSGAEELRFIYINLDSYDSIDKCDTVQFNPTFECFQCYFKTSVHKDLYLHNRKMHQKTILLCVMCKNNFYSYSELLCHLCPGTYDSEYAIKFRCCICNVDNISSSFRLMVHLRKIHHTCDVCLELCQSQARLSNHVWKHKLHHLCYRCGIAYRNKPDITNHLFWKHGTESVLCKKCLQKKWPHVYHFCTPPPVFACDECNLQFTRAVCLKVHKRFHLEEFPHVCTEEDCTEKFVSKKLLNKHLEEHRKKVISENLVEEKAILNESNLNSSEEVIPVIDLVDDKTIELGCPVKKAEAGNEQQSKRIKKKKQKDKDALLLDVNLPALNLSESDSSDESDSGSLHQDRNLDKPELVLESNVNIENYSTDTAIQSQLHDEQEKNELREDKPSEQKILEIWDNFNKYQAKVEKHKDKTPPLVPIRKHVCESDHDYCVVPTDINGDDDVFGSELKKNKKSPKKKRNLSGSSSSSSSDSDSSCSCGSNCSCSTSSGSSSSTSSDSDSSDESGNEKDKKKNKQLKKSLPSRRLSNCSNVDVMGMSETPILIPEKSEPPIAESDLETEESETDEEFYDENPQQIANKLLNEKRNQLLLLASVAPADGGSISGDISCCTTPAKEEENKDIKVEINIVKGEEKEVKDELDYKEKSNSSKKKSKKRKKSKSSRKHGPIKMTIPKDLIANSDTIPTPHMVPNKITISLQSNTVHLPQALQPPLVPAPARANSKVSSNENKRASKRRRVPNKFYGYSSDEESPQTVAALKPTLPPKLEWRKEDLPSPVTHKPKKELPSTVIPQRMFNYNEPIRLTTPIPDPEPPRFLMNSESMESSDSDSSNEENLEIYQPLTPTNSTTAPPPTYLNSGTSSLPYTFQRPASARQAREGESVYCYCRCPYDEVSEMIACDADGCSIEWFHFECVGIMVPPKGKWYCPQCRKV